MMVESIAKNKFANDLGILDSSGQISERVVAKLMRTPLARWGLSPKRAVLKYTRDQLRACGIEDVSCVQKVFKRLIALGECTEVYVGNEAYLAPSEPRFVPIGSGKGAYLGVMNLPNSIPCVPSEGGRNVVQRIQVNSNDEIALLRVAGVREISIGEWLTPYDYLRYASSRMNRPVKGDTFSLKHFWGMLETALSKEGLPLSEEAEVRAVTGEAGQFFGSRSAATVEGRWSSSPPDGVWCAYRKGYNEAHWHPAVISVDGHDRRALDLYDGDEWRWALLARGKANQLEEVVHVGTERVQVTFPLPSQLSVAMDILGEQTSPWEWSINSGAVNIWGFIE